MAVESTPTTEDRNKYKKDLESEITVLRATRETEERNAKAQVEAATKAREDLKALHAQIAEITALIPEVSHETRQFIAHCQAVIRESGAKMTEMVAMVVLIAKASDSASQELTRAKKEAASVHDTAVREEAVMQRQREDLDIYHERLKKHFAEHLPDQKIIL